MMGPEEVPMATDLTALAETFARYSRQVAGLAEPPPDLTPAAVSPGAEPARRRVVEQMRDLAADQPPPAGRLQQMWVQALRDIGYLDRDEYLAAVDRYRVVAAAGLAFVTACRAALTPANGAAELLDTAELRYRFVADVARRKRDEFGRPLPDAALERLAERERNPQPGLTIEEAITYYDALRGGRRAGTTSGSSRR
jgi:hypothetical protein